MSLKRERQPDLAYIPFKGTTSLENDKKKSLNFRYRLAQGGGGGTRPGTEKRCSHNLQSDPLGSGLKKGRENFLL